MELATVYRTVIRPILDYCAVVYHPMLSDEQDQAVERLQARALKTSTAIKIAMLSCARRPVSQLTVQGGSSCATSSQRRLLRAPASIGSLRGREDLGGMAIVTRNSKRVQTGCTTRHCTTTGGDSTGSQEKPTERETVNTEIRKLSRRD